MEGLNENAGLVVLIASIVMIAILCIIVWLLVETRKKIAVQRLKFIGQFSADPATRKNTNGKIVLKKISIYAMDSTGIAYIGKASDVKKLLSELAKNGVDYLPPAFEPQTSSAEASAPASASAARPAQSAEKPKTSYTEAFSKKVEEVSAAKDKAPKA